MNSGGIGLLATLLVRAGRDEQRLLAFSLDGSFADDRGSPSTALRRVLREPGGVDARRVDGATRHGTA